MHLMNNLHPLTKVRLLRMLRFLEDRRGYRLIGAYVRTYHNLTSDLITRAGDEEYEREMKRLGLSEVDVTKAWEELAPRGFEQDLQTLSRDSDMPLDAHRHRVDGDRPRIRRCW